MVYKQLTTMKNKDLGFNKDQVIVMKLPSYLDTLEFNKIQPLKNELLKNPSVLNFATTENFVGSGRMDFFIRDSGKNRSVTLNINWGDYNYIDLLNIKLKEGRNFSKSFGEDAGNFLINESAAKFLDWKDPIGKEMSFNGTYFGKVIGVMKDFNYRSPHSKIEPLAIALPNERNATGSIVLLKIRPDNISKSLEYID